MTATIETRAGALLMSLIRGRGTTAVAVEEALGLQRGEVAGLIEGAERLDLARLDRVLAHLGASLAEFFAQLYAGAPLSALAVAPAAAAGVVFGADEAIPRQEVEALLRELRGMIDGMVRVLDAERLLSREESD